MKILEALVVLSCVWSAAGYPGRAPPEACISMTPNHGVPADPSTPPFTVTASSDTYYSGQEITVTVSADDEAVPFKGFFIQARSEGSTDPVGTFFMGSETEIQVISCPGGTGVSNGVSHNSNVDKTSKAFMWSNEAGADIFFQATFVNNVTTFWTNVRSPTLTEVNMTETSTVATTTESSNSSRGVYTRSLLLLLAVVVAPAFLIN